MEYPSNLLYTKDHEWAEKSGTPDVITVGITHHAQEALGEIVFVELPKVGRQLKTHETFGVVESIKAVSDLYSPVSGTVLEVNSDAASDPSLINREPHKTGWLIRIKLSNPNELGNLMNASDYRALISN